MCEHRPDWLRVRNEGEIYCTVCRMSNLDTIRCYCGLEYVGEHGHNWHLDKGWILGESFRQRRGTTE